MIAHPRRRIRRHPEGLAVAADQDRDAGAGKRGEPKFPVPCRLGHDFGGQGRQGTHNGHNVDADHMIMFRGDNQVKMPVADPRRLQLHGHGPTVA